MGSDRLNSSRVRGFAVKYKEMEQTNINRGTQIIMFPMFNLFTEGNTINTNDN